jgi:hypothetical protein
MDYLASHLAVQPGADDAAAALDGAIDSLTSLTASVSEFAVDLVARLEPPTNEQVKAFKEWILAGPRTPEWSAVIARISDGELTWESVASGDVDRDPGVDAAMRSIPRIDPTALPAPARPGPPEAGPGAAAPPENVHRRPTARVDDEDDDDDFDGFTIRA